MVIAAFFAMKLSKIQLDIKQQRGSCEYSRRFLPTERMQEHSKILLQLVPETGTQITSSQNRITIQWNCF